MNGTKTRPASAKQVAFGDKLGIDVSEMTVTQASAAIDQALAAQREARRAQMEAQSAAMVQFEAGRFYLWDGEVFLAKASKSTGRAYAMHYVFVPYVGAEGETKYRLTKVYDGKLSWALREALTVGEAQQLTVEQAAEMGRQYGICAICGADLEDKASVERGIGPVCIKKLG